jgi:hypothetical protein
VIIKESMQVQKKELRSIFKEEFGLFKKDSTVKSTKKTNTKFQVDWEEKTAPEKIPEKTPAIKKRKTFEEEEGFQIEFDE